MSATEAGRVVSLCAGIEASISAVKALAAARLADVGTWKAEGYRSAEEQLADRTGVGTGQARRQLQNARRLSDNPEVAQAALSGQLSAQQAELVAAGAEADRSKAGALIEMAREASLGELREEVAQVRAMKMDMEAQRQRIHAARKLRRFVDLDGVWHLMASGGVDDGMTVGSLLTPIRQRLSMVRRAGGQNPQTFDQLEYDALVALAEIACGRDGELSFTDLLDLGLFSQLPRPGSPAPPKVSSPALSPSRPTGASPLEAPEPVPSPPMVPPGRAPAGLLPRNPASGLPVGDFSGPPVATLFDVPSPPEVEPVTPGALEPSVRPEPPGPPGAPETDGPSPQPAPFRPSKLMGRPVQLMIRVDLDTLLRGVPIEGELCEIPGYGPVPVSVIKDLTASGSVFVSAVLTRSQQIVGVYRYGRRPSASQQTALDFLYPSCAVRGCNRKAALEYEHRVDWKDTHYTVYDLMDRLCWFHHQQKTKRGWMLVEGTGKRAFVAPDDPRHPGRHPRHRTSVAPGRPECASPVPP